MIPQDLRSVEIGQKRIIRLGKHLFHKSRAAGGEHAGVMIDQWALIGAPRLGFLVKERQQPAQQCLNRSISSRSMATFPAVANEGTEMSNVHHRKLCKEIKHTLGAVKAIPYSFPGTCPHSSPKSFDRESADQTGIRIMQRM